MSASFVVSSQNSQPRSSCAGLFCSALQSFTFRAARNHERTVFHLSPDALKSISKSGRRFFRYSKKRRPPERLAASGCSFAQKSHSRSMASFAGLPSFLATLAPQQLDPL